MTLKELMALIAQVGVPTAMMVAWFWWAAVKLIPQLQRERAEAITSFKEEMTESRHAFAHQMEEERKAHQLGIERVVRVHEKAVDGMLEHMRTNHIAQH